MWRRCGGWSPGTTRGSYAGWVGRKREMLAPFDVKAAQPLETRNGNFRRFFRCAQWGKCGQLIHILFIECTRETQSVTVSRSRGHTSAAILPPSSRQGDGFAGDDSSVQYLAPFGAVIHSMKLMVRC